MPFCLESSYKYSKILISPQIPQHRYLFQKQQLSSDLLVDRCWWPKCVISASIASHFRQFTRTPSPPAPLPKQGGCSLATGNSVCARAPYFERAHCSLHIHRKKEVNDPPVPPEMCRRAIRKTATTAYAKAYARLPTTPLESTFFRYLATKFFSLTCASQHWKKRVDWTLKSLSATDNSVGSSTAAVTPVGHHREPESKQMLEPQSRAWQKWQRMGCLTFGRAKVNKCGLYGPL